MVLFCSKAKATASRRPRPVERHPFDSAAAIVRLTRGQVAVIDASDAAAVGQFSWSTCASGRSGRCYYAVRGLPRAGGATRLQKLHRFLWQLWGMPEAQDIDHIDGDGLNNRRANLRGCSRAENLRNQRTSLDSKSGLKGVFWDRNKYVAQIRVDGKMLRLGRFDSATDAHAAYAAAARRHFGDFARAS